MRNINNCPKCNAPLNQYEALFCEKCTPQKLYEMQEQSLTPEKKYRMLWETKSTSKIKAEIKSWESYMQKHESAYHWHGKSMTPPGSLADGDKISILKEILYQR